MTCRSNKMLDELKAIADAAKAAYDSARSNKNTTASALLAAKTADDAAGTSVTTTANDLTTARDNYIAEVNRIYSP